MALLLFLIAILGGSTFAARKALPAPSRLPPHPLPEGTTIVQHGAPLTFEQGHWYRVKGMTNAALIDDRRRTAPVGETQKTLQKELTEDLETQGFSNTKLAMQDPSEPLIWNFITQWSKPNPTLGLSPEGKLQVLSYQEVIEPPVVTPKPEPPVTLEAGIPYDEAHAVAYALAKDNDPKHLQYFADSMVPDFPLSAGLLVAKAKLETAITDERGKVQPEPAPVGDLKRLTQGLGRAVEGLWDKYAKSPLAPPQVAPAGRLNGPAPQAGQFPFYSRYPRRRYPRFGSVNLQGMTIEQLVAGAVRLGEKGEKEIRLMLSKLVMTPAAAALPPAELAKAFGIDEMSARCALACILRLPRNIVVIEPDIMRRILPSGPLNISVTAIHLVQATRTAKAEVTSPKTALSRMNEVSQAAAQGHPDAVLAKEQIVRASKALDRRKWIENYLRIEEGRKLPAMEAPMSAGKDWFRRIHWTR
jgi:hypothetical protein